MTNGRRFEVSHPWIRFDPINPERFSQQFWLSLGEAKARCESLSRVALPPGIAQELQQIALVKGVHATTAIEGNTLTEDQVARLVDNEEIDLPESMEYQEREVKNIIGAFNDIAEATLTNEEAVLSVERICAYNRRALAGLEDTLEEGVVPGEVRKIEVGVPGYRGAPAEDCPYLMDRYVQWLDDLDGQDDTRNRIAIGLIKATLAHLYLAWIHPFGDGNGRTARLIEFQILMRAGAPMSAAHLLSNHYHQTRSRYYQELTKASQAGDGIESFLSYAVEGFVEQVSQQWSRVQEYQFRLAWRDFVDSHFAGQVSVPARRRRRLALDLSDTPGAKAPEIRTLSPKLEEWYRDKKMNTITRDLNWLEREGLVKLDAEQRYLPNFELMAPFLPPVRR